MIGVRIRKTVSVELQFECDEEELEGLINILYNINKLQTEQIINGPDKFERSDEFIKQAADFCEYLGGVLNQEFNSLRNI